MAVTMCESKDCISFQSNMIAGRCDAVALRQAEKEEENVGVIANMEQVTVHKCNQVYHKCNRMYSLGLSLLLSEEAGKHFMSPIASTGEAEISQCI